MLCSYLGLLIHFYRAGAPLVLTPDERATLESSLKSICGLSVLVLRLLDETTREMILECALEMAQAHSLGRGNFELARTVL